jgi:hypothetical protein
MTAPSRLKRHLSLLAWVTLVAVPGCDLLATEPPSDETKLRLLSLEGGLSFGVQELHGFSLRKVGEPDVVFGIGTEQIYHSVSYALAADVRVEGQTIDVSVAGVLPCDVCLGMVGPAGHAAKLPLSEGEYSLVIRYAGKTDRYSLLISAEAIEIRKEIASFTLPKFERFWRYPRDSFVYICNAGIDAEACREFREMLHTNFALQPLSFAPGGVIPYPMSHAAYGDYWRAEHFYYQSEADFAAAGQLLRMFASSRPGAMLSLTNWRNESYLSWFGG